MNSRHHRRTLRSLGHGGSLALLASILLVACGGSSSQTTGQSGFEGTEAAAEAALARIDACTLVTPQEVRRAFAGGGSVGGHHYGATKSQCEFASGPHKLTIELGVPWPKEQQTLGRPPFAQGERPVKVSGAKATARVTVAPGPEGSQAILDVLKGNVRARLALTDLSMRNGSLRPMIVELAGEAAGRM